MYCIRSLVITLIPHTDCQQNRAERASSVSVILGLQLMSTTTRAARRRRRRETVMVDALSPNTVGKEEWRNAGKGEREEGRKREEEGRGKEREVREGGRRGEGRVKEVEGRVEMGGVVSVTVR